MNEQTVGRVTQLTENKRPTLKLPEKKYTQQEFETLTAQNIELSDTLQRLCEAITNHRLNSKCATSADVVLWDTMDSLIDMK